MTKIIPFFSYYILYKIFYNIILPVHQYHADLKVPFHMTGHIFNFIIHNIDRVMGQQILHTFFYIFIFSALKELLFFYTHFVLYKHSNMKGHKTKTKTKLFYDA